MSEQPGLVVVENIFKTYSLGETKVHALNGVSLYIYEGDFFIITGRNGSGKSTLLHQLGLLDFPDSGRIYLRGKEVTALSEKERTRLRLNYLGYVFQEYALIAELTALENVMLPAMMLESPRACRQRALGLLARVGLERQMDHLPTQLSGGEQQKVAIARALINNPTVLFADEPTANLDSVSAGEVLAIFQELNRDHQHTIAMITHEQEETVYASRLIKLVDGRLA
jgi:putative ABC transport system ATP-binding protein